jgi:hypothetical protein
VKSCRKMTGAGAVVSGQSLFAKLAGELSGCDQH